MPHNGSLHGGPSHKQCNLKLFMPRKVPVIFHNLRGYDSHFLMQEISKFKLPLQVTPTNSERYMTFHLAGRHLVFLDSFQFMIFT